MFIVRQRDQRRTTPQSCGCPNMMVVTQDKVTAVDLNQVVMVKSTKETKQKGVLSSSDYPFRKNDKT